MGRLRKFLPRPKKKREIVSDDVAAVLRGFIANTWMTIGAHRKKHSWKTAEKPWNPCLQAQQNYVAWCRGHGVDPKCWDNFVYYFGLRPLFRDFSQDLPPAMTLATMGLEIATGRAELWPSYFDYKPVKEKLESYKDYWDVVLTVRGQEPHDEGQPPKEFRFKKKIRIIAESRAPHSGEMLAGPVWSISYENPGSGYRVPAYRSRTVIDLMGAPGMTRDASHQWWRSVLESLGIEFPWNATAHVQPKTHRKRHEILYAHPKGQERHWTPGEDRSSDEDYFLRYG